MPKNNGNQRNQNNPLRTFGVFISWFRGEYQRELISGLEYAAKELDINLIYFSGRCLDSPFPYDCLQNTVYELALHAELDGLVFTSLLTHYTTEQELTGFLKKYDDLPIVTIDCEVDKRPALLLNNKPGFEQLLTHLLGDHGYRRPVFIQGPPGNLDARERQTMYQQALSSAHLPLEPLRMVQGDYSYLSGRKAVVTLCDERGLKPGRDFDAVIAANDLMAFGVRDELQARGIAVPGTVALTGYDDSHDSRFNPPLLTTVRQPIFEMGRAAIRKLVNYRAAAEPSYFDTQLVIRNSCGCPEAIANMGKSEACNSVYTKAAIPEYFTYQLIYVSDALKQSLNREELEKEIYHGLPSLGITTCYLLLNTGGSDLTMLFGYNERGLLPDVYKKHCNFASLVRNLLQQRQERFSCVILPLVLRDEPFGFVMMNVKADAWIVYETIRSQLCSSLKSVFLIEDVNKANRELADVNRQLQLAQEQKTRFFINIAHETKTPLTLIKNYLSKYMAEHAADTSLLIIRQNLDLLLDNMVNFLDAEKIAQGKQIYNHRQITDFSSLLAGKVTLYQELAAKKQLSLNLEVAAGVAIQADPYALDRVLNNMLDNALKFTPEQGRIEVRLRETEQGALLSIRDSGVGMDKAQIPYIFEPYRQLTQELGRNQGIGMGLYIVKSILDEIGATITVESEKNRGSLFVITFSVAGGPVSLQKFAPGIPSHSLPLLRKPEEAAISPDKPALLIVEDNLPMLAFLQSALREKYSVFLATDIRSAFMKLERIPKPELIISDIMMEHGDGHQFLQKLAQQKEYNDIPFIFITAKHSQEDRLAGLAEGAIDYILKPFSIEELSNKIDTIIGLRAKQRNQEAKKLKEKIVNLLTDEQPAVHDQDFYQFEEKCLAYRLSRREKDVLSLVLKGLLNKEIAQKLNITTRSVEFHMTNLYRKLQIKDRYALFSFFKAHS